MIEWLMYFFVIQWSISQKYFLISIAAVKYEIFYKNKLTRSLWSKFWKKVRLLILRELTQT